MTRFYSQEQTITTVTRLTRTRLETYLRHNFLCPAMSEQGPMYSAADLARIELICDLSDEFELNSEALGVVLSLIDQLHGLRGELRRVMDVIDAQPSDVKTRIAQALA